MWCSGFIALLLTSPHLYNVQERWYDLKERRKVAVSERSNDFFSNRCGKAGYNETDE